VLAHLKAKITWASAGRPVDLTESFREAAELAGCLHHMVAR